MHSLQKMVLLVSDAHKELKKDGPNLTSAKLISSAKALSCLHSHQNIIIFSLQQQYLSMILVVGEVAKASF